MMTHKRCIIMTAEESNKPLLHQQRSSIQFDCCPLHAIWHSIQWRRQDLLRGGATLEIISRRTSGPGAAAARWLIVLWLMQYWSKELWVVDIILHHLISQTTQYLDSWLSDLLKSELTMILSEVEGSCAPAVSHSWRRHWLDSHFYCL